ncbi:MAG: phage tail tape measure protein, partial [Alistipes sp.]|nr:phage tail tape measure protein [Alistipes sp.]
MASYTTNANVVISVNGKQAQKMLTALEKDAKRLEKQVAAAAAAGDKVSMKKYQRELNATKRTMDQLRGSASNVDNVLRRLDKATPKELNRALRQLQQQLNGIQRGTAAWDAHVAKIQAVKAEIQRVNATMATQKSLWSRMNSWLNNCQTAILGIGAAITGLVMAGRKAVNAFAQMDEELANTRKYTGMAADDVDKLNEAFKRMDTRTPREKLNELAQEAGRLGLNTLESVQGYVEAADIINVALVDLGDGATQTIAKLTNIFGVQELLGTKDAMLAVGSTVNVLSQNCTASKPYLVEFAQRMAGIGSQAGLTIPQILAFGAV